jgi:hypothetical protein
MFKITDILSLGSDYTVSDSNGVIIKTIQVIPFTELLSAALGPYTDDFGSYTNYIEKSVATLSGFNDIDPNRILWYATEDDEVALADLIEYSIKNGYDRIILEHLELLD